MSSDPAGIECGSDCEASFEQGATITLTATPADGWQLAGWEGACSGTGKCTVTMNAAQQVTASFTKVTAEPSTEPSPSLVSQGNPLLQPWPAAQPDYAVDLAFDRRRLARAVRFGVRVRVLAIPVARSCKCACI